VKKYGRLLGSVILVGLLAGRIDWRQVASAFAQLDAAYWLLALGLYLLTQGVSAARWQMLGHMLGLGGRWRDYLAYYFIGMFFNLVLPTSVGGDVVRAWYLTKSGRRVGGGNDGKTTVASTSGSLLAPGLAAFLSVLADRVNGLVVLIGVACMATLCCPTPLPGWIVALVAAMGAVGLLGLAVLPFLPWLRKRLPMHRRLTPLLDGAHLCLRDRRGLIGVTLLSLVVQLANIVLAWLVGQGLGLQVPLLYYGVLIPLVSILTLLPISLNGMGLREAGTVLLLGPLHVSSAAAVTLSLLLFAVYAAASLLGGAVYLFGRSPRSSMEASGHADPVGGDSDQGRMREPSAAA
jgi:uncharacterized membrane protein YbhN (UPF0104 family)